MLLKLVVKIVEKWNGFQNSILTYSEFSQTPIILRQRSDLTKHTYFNENWYCSAYGTLCEKCHNSVFSGQYFLVFGLNTKFTEYWDLQSKFQYSVRIRENTDQKNFIFIEVSFEKYWIHSISPFHANIPFLYPLKTFQGVY